MNDTDRTARLAALVDLAYEAAAAAGNPAGEPDGDGPAARILAEIEALRGGAAVVVCVGEKKRGKSSLINALTGHPDLLPVDLDVASSVHVLVRHGEVPEAVVHRHDDHPARDGRPTAEPLPSFEQIAEYAALDPKTQQPRHPDVSHLDIAIPAAVLRPGLVLVDTPGVGGLVAGHAQLTMATLRRADALLFVTDGSSELTCSELAFLEKATERIATVVFVLTKIDKYPHWRDVLEKSRALVRAHAPRYARAPWFAVSAAMEEDALAAERSGDRETTERRRTAGGCRDLGQALARTIAERAEDVRMANAAQVVRGSLEPLAAHALRMLDVASGGSDATAEVERLQRAIAGEKGAAAAWRKTLGTRTQDLEAAVLLHFRRSVNDLRASAGDQIALAGTAAALEALPDSLDQGVRAAWLELETTLGEGLREIIGETGREIEAVLGGEAGSGTASTNGAFGLPLPDRLRNLKPPARSAHDQHGFGAFAERMVPAWGGGTLTFGIAAFATGGLLIPAALGAGVTALLVARRRRRSELVRERSDAQRYVAKLIGELTTEVPPLIKTAVVEARDRLTRLIAMTLEQRDRELRAELRAYREVIAREKEERDRLAADARARHALVVRLLTRLDALVPDAGPAGSGRT